MGSRLPFSQWFTVFDRVPPARPPSWTSNSAFPPIADFGCFRSGERDTRESVLVVRAETLTGHQHDGWRWCRFPAPSLRLAPPQR